MSHIRFDENGVPVVVDEPTRSVFAALERSSSSMRETIAANAADPSRCLGRFVVMETVERSAAGALHQAFDPQEQRFVAVRTVDGVGALSRDAQRTLETATLLRHPNILAPLAGGFGVAADGRLFLACEMAPGRSLEPRRKQEELLEPGVAATIVRDLARALGYAQGLGMVHGALHPASVLVDGRGHARLIDWGVAAAEAGSPSRRAALVQRLERRGCRAPERREGDAGDTPGDVYGLGALLLRLAAGKTPGLLVPEDDGPDPALPSTLEPVVRRCLEPAPLRRYASPVAVARDLDRWLQGERPEACAMPLGRRLGRCWRQVRGAVRRAADRVTDRAAGPLGGQVADGVTPAIEGPVQEQRQP